MPPPGVCTTGTMGTVVDTVAYTYGDTTWRDLMTTYDGNWIHYDGVGNPDTDGTWDYTWRNGRELASMTNGSTIWTFTYNADGIRTQKTDGTTVYKYTYNGSTLTQLDVGTNRLFFVYDGTSPTAVVYNGTTYYYQTNLQGDIIALLNSSGTKVVEYTYDAWGNILSTTGTLASTLGVLNPLRYRGYVYDAETGLYYLQSRYYNPEIGRFINADAFSSTGQGLLGNNMFAYCVNDPICNTDVTGMLYERTAGGGGGGSLAYAGSIGEQTITIKSPKYIPIPILFIPLSTRSELDTLRAETIAVRKTLNAESKIQAKTEALAISAATSEKPQYFAAAIIDNAVVPFVPLTYPDAMTWVTSGGDLLCVNHSAAYAIVKFFPSARWDGRHGCAESGYLNHYHLSSAHGNHIWYLGE